MLTVQSVKREERIKALEDELAFLIYCQDWDNNPENTEPRYVIEKRQLEMEIEELGAKLLLM